MQRETRSATDSWHEDVRDLNRVDSLLDRIAQRAVGDLGVDVAVARAGPARHGVSPVGARSLRSDHPVDPPGPLSVGREVLALRLPARVWWPAAGPWGADHPSALVVDLSGDPRGGSDGGARLELRATTDDFFGRPELLAAARFAAYASLTLLAVERVVHLRAALETRAVISQAQGILMERFALDSDASMNLLRRWSQDSHRQVRELAIDITQHGLPHPTTGSGEWLAWTP